MSNSEHRCGTVFCVKQYIYLDECTRNCEITFSVAMFFKSKVVLAVSQFISYKNEIIFIFIYPENYACLWRLWINYDVKMSLNTWLFTFVNKFILFLYKVHKLLMILCILAVVHVTVHDTCVTHEQTFLWNVCCIVDFIFYFFIRISALASCLPIENKNKVELMKICFYLCYFE